MTASLSSAEITDKPVLVPQACVHTDSVENTPLIQCHVRISQTLPRYNGKLASLHTIPQGGSEITLHSQKQSAHSTVNVIAQRVPYAC